MNYKGAFLQHGKDTNGPFLTEQVEFKYKPVSENPHKGGFIKSNYMIKKNGLWYRVFISSKIGPFIKFQGYHVRVLFVEV